MYTLYTVCLIILGHFGQGVGGVVGCRRMPARSIGKAIQNYKCYFHLSIIQVLLYDLKYMYMYMYIVANGNLN